MPDIAVLMPSHSKFDKIFETVEQLCSHLGFSARRLKPLQSLEDLDMEEIKNAVAIVADVSEIDINTAIGIGVSLAQHKLIIPVTRLSSSAKQSPIQSEKVIVYSLAEPGLKQFQKDIYKSLKSHKTLIKENVQRMQKKQEVTYGALQGRGKNSQGFDEYFFPPEGINFVEIPEGSFLYGEGKRQMEQETFLMGKYLLTNRQWASFLDKTKYAWKGHWLGRPKGKLKRVREYPEEMAEHPIVDISFHDLQAYVDWLNQEYGDKEMYFQIPTEKQWEKAARGWDGRAFPWGDEIPNPELALYEQDLRHGTLPVDSFSQGASPYGCYHMAGNVFEWTSSFYPFDFKSRAVRGGSYAIEPIELSTFMKFSRRPEIGHWTSGGRICVLVW